MEPALEVGVVCGSCDAYSPMGAMECRICGHDLALFSGERAAPPLQPFDDLDEVTIAYEPERAPREVDRVSPPARAELDREEPMDQAKNYICESCQTPVPSGHKFCVRCGAPIPEHILNLRTDFFSDMQDPGKARVILIRGQDMEGLSYHLKADQHLVGRGGALDFSDDAFVSPKHANLFYRDGKLVVRDEGSLNGVYVRVRGSVDISPGESFLAGEQLFRLDPTPKASDGADTDGTFFYSSPKYPSAFRLNQILEGGAIGMTVCARGSSLQIGREDGDLNFPGDVYMSSQHCTVEEKDGKFVLTDHGSRNGTYVRIRAERELGHGDYLFIGKKLLRVEMNVN